MLTDRAAHSDEHSRSQPQEQVTRASQAVMQTPLFLLTLARTGLRLGEAVGMECRDVDFAQRVLVIRRSVRKSREPAEERQDATG